MIISVVQIWQAMTVVGRSLKDWTFEWNGLTSLQFCRFGELDWFDFFNEKEIGEKDDFIEFCDAVTSGIVEALAQTKI